MYMKNLFSILEFIKINKSVWNSRWSTFKNKMLSVPSVKAGTGRVRSRWYGWNHDRIIEDV